MKNFTDLMSKAKEAQERLKKLQDNIAQKEVSGKSGGGMVEIVMTCKGEVKKVHVDDSLIVPAEKPVLEDLLTAAFNDARAKAEEIYAREMEDLKGSLNLPF